MFKGSCRHCLTCLFAWVAFTLLAQDERYLPGHYPDRIILGLGKNETQRSVNWRVHKEAPEQYVQWELSDGSSNLAETAKTVLAEAELTITEGLEARYCSYQFEGLVPGATYVYRVGGGAQWSEWFQFRVAERDNAFSFIYLGDAQNDMRDLWSRSMRAAVLKNPEADFYIHLGDMVDQASKNQEWGEWHYGGGWMMSGIPQILVPGNHEYVERNSRITINDFWRRSFSMPVNGPKDLEEVVYYIDYENTRFIVIDSRNMLISEAQSEIQAKWLEKVLQTNDKKWTIVSHHHPIFSARGNRAGYMMSEYLEPIYNRYKVDLVLQGHHHSFARGRKAEEVGARQHAGPVYFVSNSGPKMYDTNFADWMERVATNVQMFHNITIKDDKLQVYSYLVNGELYDHIVLTKLPNGDKEFEEIEVTDVEERLEFSTATYGADIDQSPEYKKVFEKRSKEYLKKRKNGQK